MHVFFLSKIFIDNLSLLSSVQIRLSRFARLTGSRQLQFHFTFTIIKIHENPSSFSSFRIVFYATEKTIQLSFPTRQNQENYAGIDISHGLAGTVARHYDSYFMSVRLALVRNISFPLCSDLLEFLAANCMKISPTRKSVKWRRRCQF